MLLVNPACTDACPITIPPTIPSVCPTFIGNLAPASLNKSITNSKTVLQLKVGMELALEIKSMFPANRLELVHNDNLKAATYNGAAQIEKRTAISRKTLENVAYSQETL